MKKGMEMAEVMELIARMGWELVEDEQYEEDGTVYHTLTVWQGDHGCAVAFGADGKVADLEYIPEWAM